MVMPLRFEDRLTPDAEGLFCAGGEFYIDPPQPVDHAVITHGHSDHARAGHGAVLATAETIEVMKVRLGADCAGNLQALALSEHLTIRDVTISLRPAGHILGSAQVVIEHRGQRAVVSGDYKRTLDPTCAPFELVPCDLFVTEATFGLPVFRHELADKEVAKLLASVRRFPERTHLVGVYGLGKCQRVIKVLRQAGYDKPIWLHGALKSMCDLYVRLGLDLGDLRLVSEAEDQASRRDRPVAALGRA